MCCPKGHSPKSTVRCHCCSVKPDAFIEEAQRGLVEMLPKPDRSGLGLVSASQSHIAASAGQSLGLPLGADMAAAGQKRNRQRPPGLSCRIRGVPYDPANLIGREAATPWDRGRSYAPQPCSFDRID